MKTVVSGKRTVEYVKPSKRELENELMNYLNTKGVHIDKDVWEETVDYILSFWDEQDYKPRDTYEAINDWYNDTKKFFPEMFGKGRKVASARYLRWIKNHRLIKSSRRPVKSSADNLPLEVYYMVVQGAKMYYSTDYDKVADMVRKINSEPGPRVYGPYTEDDPEEIQELYEVGYIGNSRKTVKSSIDSYNEAIEELGEIDNEFALYSFVKDILDEHGMSDKYEAFVNETDNLELPEELGAVAEKYIGMALKSSRKPVKSSQKGFHNVAEGTKYDDYHVDTTGMGILDVEYAIEAIEDRGNQAVLTVQTNDGAVQHTYFTLNDWKKYKDAKNANGTAVTDVWITEVNPTYTKITNSRKPIKSATGYSIEDYDPNISLSDNLYYQNPNVKPGLNSEMSFHLLDYAMEQGVPYDECKDWTYREWQDFVRSKSPKITNSRKNQKIKNSYNCNRSKRMIKSGRNEKIMQAYDTADYIYENIMNRGQMYDKWFINKPQYAQDAAYICVEHTDFSVRLWFEFTNTDFCYVTGYFTNGSSYDKQVIGSWSYGGFETALNDVKSYLDNFFEIGGGLDSLRQKLGE